MRNTALVFVALLTIGCSGSSTPTPVASAASPSTTADAQEESKSAADEAKSWTEEKRIVEIARKAYFAQGGSDDGRTQVDKPFRHEDGTWSVVFTPLPAVPGGHTFVHIDSDGKVLGINGGL